MKTTLNWGLLSTARINRKVIPAIRASRRAKLLAVASRTQNAAEEYARAWKIPRAHGSYEALLHDPEIDVIYNPLPNHLHAAWTIRAVQAGKHVLCEKPLTLTLEEMDAIMAAAQRHNRVVAEAFMYRHHPKTLAAKKVVESGDLGKINLIRGSFSFVLDRPDDYRNKPDQGGGSLWDIGCYPVSYTRYLLGLEPLEVFGWQVTGGSGIDETFVGQMRFPGDIYAQFDSSFTVPYHTFMEVIGTGGTLVIPTPFAPGKKEPLVLSRDGKNKTITIPGEELYLGEIEDMASAALDGKPARMSLQDSRANLAALLALYQSARTGQPVSL